MHYYIWLLWTIIDNVVDLVYVYSGSMFQFQRLPVLISGRLPLKDWEAYPTLATDLMLLLDRRQK